jgi:hypothetical protein
VHKVNQKQLTNKKMAFYMTLPCSASKDAYPDNRIGRYTTRLARPLDLTGAWEVGLSEIILPQVRVIISEEATYVLSKLDNVGKPVIYTQTLRKGEYDGVHDIAHIINFNSPPCARTHSPCLNIMFKDGWAVMHVAEGSQIHFESLELCKILGVEPHKSYHAGRHEFRVGSAMSVVYVYCSIAEHIAVGDALVPCLRTVPVFSHSGEQIVERYENPHYVPLLKNESSTIEIELTDDEGNEIKFGKGLSLVKLHLRPRKH